LAWAPISGTLTMAWTIALTKIAAVIVTFVVAIWVVNSAAAEGEPGLLVEQ